MINCVFGHGLHVLYGMLIDLRYDLGNSPSRFDTIASRRHNVAYRLHLQLFGGGQSHNRGLRDRTVQRNHGRNSVKLRQVF